jgi:hypothetical protein
MRFVDKFLLIAALLSAAQAQTPQLAPRGPQIDPPSTVQSEPENPTAADNTFLTIPSGTKVILAMTSPVWAKSAHLGDTVYAVTAFPVAINNTIAIPPGTYVEGEIDSLTRPTRKTNRAEFAMHFTKLVFANGYTVSVPDHSGNSATIANRAAVDPNLRAVPPETGSAVATVHVAVYFTSDILLDNGAQIEMLLQRPITLNALLVAAAVRQSKAPQIQWAASTRCRPRVGTPGTPDTIIPGTPGSPGTPDTVIPGANGAPPTVIPGIPATAGTPATVIPGSLGTPGTVCPGPPAVITETADVHKESFKVPTGGVRIAGQNYSKGTYQLTWNGPGPDAQVEVLQKGNVLATVSAHVVKLMDAPSSSRVDVSSDGSAKVLSIQFARKNYALTFGPPGPPNV